jgi:ATP/maltotriose-dependent transcriptional regulator MalT
MSPGWLTGFGKITLLAGWAAGASWPVAWLSLDLRGRRPGQVLAACGYGPPLPASA